MRLGAGQDFCQAGRGGQSLRSCLKTRPFMDEKALFLLRKEQFSMNNKGGLTLKP